MGMHNSVEINNNETGVHMPFAKDVSTQDLKWQTCIVNTSNMLVKT